MRETGEGGRRVTYKRREMQTGEGGEGRRIEKERKTREGMQTGEGGVGRRKEKEESKQEKGCRLEKEE
jgi:hypothetical protein